MLLIHASRSPRVAYALDLFFGHLIPVAYRITSEVSNLVNYQGPAFSYGDRPLSDDVPFIQADPLLEASRVEPVEADAFRWRDTLALFPKDHEAALFPFDPFAAAFYLVSRHEEYTCADRDAHGRFVPERSILFQSGFLQQPVVNHYAVLLREALAERFPDFVWPRMPFEALSTIDVDVAYAYLGRSPGRTLAAAAQQIVRREGGSLRERLEVLTRRRDDPYDTFDWLREVHQRHAVPLLYFLLLGRGSGMDRNLPAGGKPMAELVARLAEHADLGLHPSYRSNSDFAELQREQDAFRRLTGQAATKSRQHFLKVDLPETYHRLSRIGVLADFTMGYASEPGFRAGIALPFPFYDLNAEKQSGLTVYPIAYMDGTLKVYQKLDPGTASSVIDRVAQNVGRTGGLFVSLWHNNTVSDWGPWAGWKAVFEHSLATMSRLGSPAPDAVTRDGQKH